MNKSVSPQFLALWSRDEYAAVRELFTTGDIHEIVKQYLGTALWSSVGDDGISLLIGNDVYDIAYDSRFDAATDVLAFLSRVLPGDMPTLRGLGNDGIGHNLWLNRCGDGEGFWSRGLEEVGDRLSAIATDMGPLDPIVGDDGVIHFEPEHQDEERG